MYVYKLLLFVFIVCLHFLKSTKETWEKCDITTLKHYNEKVNIIELWQKMNDVKKQTGHLNITDSALG